MCILQVRAQYGAGPCTYEGAVVSVGRLTVIVACKYGAVVHRAACILPVPSVVAGDHDGEVKGPSAISPTSIHG